MALALGLALGLGVRPMNGTSSRLTTNLVRDRVGVRVRGRVRV